MSIITVVRSIRGKLHTHFKPSSSSSKSTANNDQSGTSSAEYTPVTVPDPPTASTSTPLAPKQSLDSFHSDASSINSSEVSISLPHHRRRHVKRSLPEASSSSSGDDLSINELKLAQMIRKNRHRRRKESHPPRSKKQLGIPISSVPSSSITISVVEPSPSARLSAGISLPHFQTILKVDPSWSLADKLIQVKLAAYVSELYPGDDFDYEESDPAAVSDSDLICAVVDIGYGDPSLYEDLQEITGLDVATASRRLERIVKRVIREEEEGSDIDNDETAFILKVSG
ncbi:hypothetical protein BJ742DRAFT_864498 [Cladochytrium replicatum]|nr:hypothetical protein BJ742DRAFT_864498 [Cladochytrium replicatum]